MNCYAELTDKFITLSNHIHMTHIEDYRIKVITDIDDTVKSSGGIR